MVRIQSILVSSVALLVALLPSSVHAADEALPWDDGKVDPDQWTTITLKGRSPAFNDDTGVVTLAVDSEAIFNQQTNFRRAELVQNVVGNTKGTTFFRVSLMKEVAYVNLYTWQVIFSESHLFELRIDASVDPVKLIWYTGGGTETRWSTDFKIKTWYNFGIAVSSGQIALYFSEGDDALAPANNQSYNGDVPTNYEFHFGQLTLSNDGSAVMMAEGKQDVLSFNGVSVEDRIPSGIDSSTPSSKNPTTPATAPTSTTPATTSTSTTPTAVSKAADETATETPTTNPSETTLNVITDDDKSAATTLDSPATTNAPVVPKTKNCKVRHR
ncbi:unnamed protein product [Peronospora destructor]|uniref:Glycoside hydrolase 131 catalytic N-terminal domain-containing protein n=1 Tax=Peronospora destructor TaxID=86335 RepID=A0AAV0SU44_9STRA|nr:unnamed protein product [Peronospora destructor]